MKRIYFSLILAGLLLAAAIVPFSPSSSAQFQCMGQDIHPSRIGNGSQTMGFPCQATPETWTIPAGAVSVTVSGGASIGYPFNGGPYKFATADYGNCSGSSPFSPQLNISFSGAVRDVDVYISSGTTASNAVPFKLTDNRGVVVQITPVVNPDGSGYIPPARFTGRDITSIVMTPVGSVSTPWEFSLVGLVFTPQCAVTSVQWQQIQGPLDTNPNTGGGGRIFPDKQSATGQVMSKVKAAATTGLGANQTVHFKVFDVDDPSTDASPIDPNGSAGNDNRGTPNTGTLNSASAVTDANGNASVELTVTMQPGDNFVVAASDDLAYLNGLTANGADVVDSSGNTLPTAKASATQMLTVWRKVHIEKDSMGSVASNRATGNTSTVAPNTTTNQTAITASTTLEVNRFEKGRIVLSGVGNYAVVSNTATTITVQGIINSVPKRTSYTLYDDDDFNNNNGTTLVGDNAENVTAPDTSLIQNSDSPALNVFAPAYVRPVYDVGDNNDLVSFVLNTNTISAANIISTYDFDARGTEADPNFWTVYLFGVYQADTTADADPDSEGAILGIVDNINGQGANVFNEVLRASEITVTAAVNNAATTAHEIGHLFNGLHQDYDATGNAGLMAQSGTRTVTAFSDVTLSKIRTLNHP